MLGGKSGHSQLLAAIILCQLLVDTLGRLCQVLVSAPDLLVSEHFNANIP